VVGLQRPRALEIFIENHSGACNRGGATGLRARPELHLGAAQSGPGTVNHRDRDADNHAPSATDDNHTAAALHAANDCVAAAVRSARDDDVASARPGADTPGRAATARLRDTSGPAATARLTLMARLLLGPKAAASSPGALMARLLLGPKAAASSPGALLARLANVSQTHRYTGDP